MSVLLLTGSTTISAEVARLAAAAGHEPLVRSDPAGALAAWASAALVLVGTDLVHAVADVAPARRPGVHVVGDAPPEHVFRAAVALGAESVLDLTTAAPWLVELLTDVGEAPAAGWVVGAVGGSGGAGATTLACALAQGVATSRSVLLVDTDPLGAGVDRLLGLEETPGVRWAELHETAGRLGARALHEGVPRDGRLGVVTWGSGPRTLDLTTLRQTLSAGRRGHDVVVLDLARHSGMLLAELAGRCDLVLVVCPATVAGVAATVRTVGSVGDGAARAAIALRPGRVPPDDVAAATGLRVLVEVPDQRGVTEALDLGLGPWRRRGPLARAVREVLGEAA
jgi:secretion/DNA translocation related CpaE-like protein